MTTGPPGDEGFAIVPEAERGRKPTLGEDLDFRLALDDQAWDAVSDHVGRLEARLMVVEDVVTVLTALIFGPTSPLPVSSEGR